MGGFERLFLKIFPEANQNNLAASTFGETLLKTTKLKVILYSLLVWCFDILVFMWARYLNLEYFGFKFYTLLVFFCLFCGLILLLYKTKNIKLASYGFNFLMFFFIPIRVYQTGGVYSPAIALYTGHCIIVMTLFGRKKGFLIFLYSLFSIFLFSLWGETHSLPATPFYTNPINWGVSVLLISMMIMLPTLFIIKEKDRLEEELRKSEKNMVSQEIMKDLVRQTKVSLSKAKEKLSEALKKSEERIDEDLMEVEMNLRKIDFAVKDFSKQRDKKRTILPEFDRTKFGPQMRIKELFEFLFSFKNTNRGNIDTIHAYTKFRMLGVSAFLVGTISFCIFLFRGAFYGDLNFDTYSVLFISLSMVGFIVFLWKSGDLITSTWIMIAMVALAVPFRMYMDGGVEAPITFALFSLVIFTTALAGWEYGQVAILYGCLCLLGFSLSETFLVRLPDAFNPSAAYWGGIVCLNICFFTLPLLYILEEKEAIAKVLSVSERERTAFLVLRRLNHEIGNSLNVALGNIEFAREDADKSVLKKVGKEIDEIVSVVEKMSEASEKGRLIGFLESHQGDVKILSQMNEAL